MPPDPSTATMDPPVPSPAPSSPPTDRRAAFASLIESLDPADREATLRVLRARKSGNFEGVTHGDAQTAVRVLSSLRQQAAAPAPPAPEEPSPLEAVLGFKPGTPSAWQPSSVPVDTGYSYTNPNAAPPPALNAPMSPSAEEQPSYMGGLADDLVRMKQLGMFKGPGPQDLSMLGSVGQGIIRGAGGVMDAAGGLVRGAGQAIDAFGLPGGPEVAGAGRLLSEVSKTQQGMYPTDPNRPYSGAVGEAIPGMGAAIAAGPAGPAFFAAQGAGSAYGRTMDATGNPMKAFAAGAGSGVINAAVAPLQLAAVRGVTPGLANVLAGKVNNAVGRYVAGAGADLTLGGLANVAQAAAEDTLDVATGANPEAFKDFDRQALVAGTVGAVLSAYGAHRAGQATVKAEAAKTAQGGTQTGAEASVTGEAQTAFQAAARTSAPPSQAAPVVVPDSNPAAVQESTAAATNPTPKETSHGLREAQGRQEGLLNGTAPTPPGELTPGGGSPRPAPAITTPEPVRSGESVNSGEVITDPRGQRYTAGATLGDGKVVLRREDGRAFRLTPGEMEARGWMRTKQEPPARIDAGEPSSQPDGVPAVGGQGKDTQPSPRREATTEKPKTKASDQTKHEFSSTQFDLPKDLADATRAASMKIPDADLAEDGRETNPHITLKYGLHTGDPEAVRAAIGDAGPVEVKLGKTSVFKGEKADVVKAEVEGPALHALNQRIADALPHTDTHPKYQPHVTLAYVKPGLGEKYAGMRDLEGKTIRLDRVTFSDQNGRTTEVPLKGKEAEKAASIRIRGDEFGPDSDPKAVRQEARRFVRDNLRETGYKNEETGRTIRIGNSGIKKILANSADLRRARLLAAVPEIIRDGRLDSSMPPSDGDTRIRAYHRFSADIEYAGQPETVSFLVREDANGEWYYNHQIVEKRKNPPSKPVRGPEGPRGPAGGSSEPSIGESPAPVKGKAEESGQVTPKSGSTPEARDAAQASEDQVPKADAPGYLDRVVAWAEAKSREGRTPRPGDRPGSRFGGSEVNVYDVIAAAAKVVRGGVRTIAKVREVVREMLGKDDPETTRKAWSLVKAAETKDGTHDDGRFEALVADLLNRDQRRRPVKATIREATGQTPPGPEVSQRDALAGQLAAEAKGAARVDKVRAVQEKRDARRMQTAVGLERGAAQQSAEIQAGMAKVELSKAAKKARAQMAEERARSRADRAALARDAANTLRATLEVAGDNRKAIGKALMDLPPEVRGRRDMLALLESAETAKDAKAAGEIIQRELHRQSIREELQSLQSTRKRIKAIPRDLKDELRTRIGEITEILKGLKTDWTVRAALAGRQKGKPIVVREGKSLAEVQAAATRAGNAASSIRDKVMQALHDRRIMLEDQAKSASYVSKMVASTAKAVSKVADRVVWGSSTTDRRNKAPFMKWALQADWTVKTMSKVLDGTLGQKAKGYAEQLLFRNAVQGRRKYLGERQKATDTLDAIARKHGFRTWADLQDRAESTTIDVPWSPTNEKMGTYEVLAMLAQDPSTRELTDQGARVSLSSLGDSAPEFNIDGDRRQRLAMLVDPKMLAAIEDAKSQVIEPLREPTFRVLQNITGTTPPVIEGYFPRRARRISPEMQNPAEIQEMDSLEAARLGEQVRLERASFTKEREAGRNATFWIDNPFEVIHRHVDRAAKIIHLAEAVRAARRVFRDPDVRSAIESQLGEQTVKAIDRHIEQMALLTTPDKVPMGQFLRKLTRDVGRATTQLNPRSIGRQYGSMAMAGYDYGFGAMAKKLPEAVRTANREEMVNSNPSLRERYESDTASAGIRAATGEGKGTAARARIIDREQLRLGAKQFMRGDFREGNRRFWEAIRISNVPDSHVATAVYLIEKGKVQEEHPDWTPEKVKLAAGERTADWVDDRMNTSDPNTSSRFQKAMRETGWSTPFALFSSDRVKMWNLLLEARAADGGGMTIGKNTRRALGAIVLNNVWNRAMGLASEATLQSISALLWGRSEEDEKAKQAWWMKFGLGVARDTVGLSTVGEWAARVGELIVQGAGSAAGKDIPSLTDNPVSSTVDKAFSSIFKGAGGLLKDVASQFGDLDEEPTVKAFNADEAKLRSWMAAGRQALQSIPTAFGVPTGPLTGDLFKALTPGGPDVSRAAQAVKDGDYSAARAILSARARRMLEAGIDEESVSKSLERAIAFRLSRGLKKGQDDDAIEDNQSTAADLVSDVMP